MIKLYTGTDSVFCKHYFHFNHSQSKNQNLKSVTSLSKPKTAAKQHVKATIDGVDYAKLKDRITMCLFVLAFAFFLRLFELVSLARIHENSNMTIAAGARRGVAERLFQRHDCSASEACKNMIQKTCCRFQNEKKIIDNHL